MSTLTPQLKAYAAGGWFSPEQKKSIDQVELAIKLAGLGLLSPRAMGIFKPGSDPQDLVDGNLEAILSADVLVASTEGKDMGTLLECGYAYGKKIPIVYYYPHGGMFNIMLSGTARAVLTSEQDLWMYLKDSAKTGVFQRIIYTGAQQ
jgi:nucleoside 2-deoxyribosyltransferase